MSASLQQRLHSINEHKHENNDVDTDSHEQSPLQPLFASPSDSNENSKPPSLSRSKSTPSSSLSSPHRKASHNHKRRRSLDLLTRTHSEPHGSLIPRARRMSVGMPTLKRAKSLLLELHLPGPPVLPAQQYTVTDAIDAMEMGRFQWMIFLLTGLLFASYAVELMLVAFLLPILQKEWNISRLQSSFIPLATIIGSFIGAFVLSLLADKFGRKKVIIFGVIGTAIAAVVSAFADDIVEECVARFFVGFCMKVNVVAITILAEFLPTRISGKILILQAVFWTLGYMLCISLAWICLTYYDWRFYVKISTVPLWLAAVGALFMPESPHYLMIAGKYEECKQVLQRVSAMNHAPLPEGQLIEETVQASLRGNASKLFTEQYLATSLILLVTTIAYQAGYFGVIFVSVRYLGKLDSIYDLHHEMYWEMMLTTFSEIPGILFAYFCIDYGRKWTINVSFALFAISTYLLVILDVEFNRVLGISLLFVSRMFIAVSGMGLGVYFLEYYPTVIRATALGFAVSISMIFKFLAIVSAEALHLMFAMYIFGTFGIIAFIASLSLGIDSSKSWPLQDTFPL